VSVSTSLDGGREICDSQRGAGYFDKTMAGIRLLRENGLDVSAIATILPERPVRRRMPRLQRQRLRSNTHRLSLSVKMYPMFKNN